MFNRFWYPFWDFSEKFTVIIMGSQDIAMKARAVESLRAPRWWPQATRSQYIASYDFIPCDLTSTEVRMSKVRQIQVGRSDLRRSCNRGSKSAYVLQVMSAQHYLGMTIFDLYPTDIEIWPTHRQDLASCWLVSYILPLAVLSSQARNLT